MNRIYPVDPTANAIGWSVNNPIWSDEDEEDMKSQYRSLFPSKAEYDKFADNYRKGTKAHREQKKKEAEAQANTPEGKKAAERAAEAAYIAERTDKAKRFRIVGQEFRTHIREDVAPGFYIERSAWRTVLAGNIEYSQEDARQAMFELFPHYVPSRDAHSNPYAIPPERMQERLNRWAMEHPGEEFTPEKASAEDYHSVNANVELLRMERVLLDAEKNGRKRIVRFYEYCSPMISEPLIDRGQVERALEKRERIGETGTVKFLLEVLSGYCPIGAMSMRLDKYYSYIHSEYRAWEREHGKKDSCRDSCDCCHCYVM
jgi:hypothetical protein